MKKRMLQAVKKIFDRRKITDRGPVEFKTHAAVHKGSIMKIAAKDVSHITKSTTIKEAAEVMTKRGLRRLPVTDPGTHHLVGILSARDMLDFLGGGEKYKLFAKNKASFLNHSVSKIMEEKVHTLSDQSSIEDAIDLFLNKNIGGAPILDKNNKVIGMVSERDLVMLLSEKVTGFTVNDYMTKKVITATHGVSIADASKFMLRNGFRRLPVARGQLLHGLVTSVDLVKTIANNKIFEDKVKLEDIMVTDVVTVTPETDLGDVASKVTRHSHGAFPVVVDQRLVGMITEKDLLRAIK